MSAAAFLGIDIGTSGIRAVCIDKDERELAAYRIAFPSRTPVDGRNEQDPNLWLPQLDKLLSEVSLALQQFHDGEHQGGYKIAAIAIDGTSSTLIACKKDGTALSPALMYNDQQNQKQAEIISHFAPAETAVHGASSSLAKALNLLERHPDTAILCHQADWLASSLTGEYGISDENNCLKLGYDSVQQRWPSWLLDNIRISLLPEVVPSGSRIGRVKKALINKYQLADDCSVISGTTDSNAAVLASGASQPGDAVTSLGSTLVLKLFSDRPVFDPQYGIYSHRLDDQWLVGGASNSGGAVLLQHFSPAQLAEMTPQLKPEKNTGLDYYPLPDTGERFPVNDSHKQSRISPRPGSDLVFFQGLLEGIANIEAEGYKKLEALGTVPVKRIFTAGGGSKNPAWTKIRERLTGIEILPAKHSEACFGSALLARGACNEK
ncbi:MAG: FGGY-family carbohydrate kinase [Proteobacteria bacterium]|nr:FGGY-family carbohydrate kinase [Pseudomonadota bacterium]